MKRINTIIFLAALLACAPARAAVDIFLCITEVPGDSTDVVFGNCIEVRSFSDAAFLESDQPEPRDFRFTKGLDSASLPLRFAFAEGTRFSQATFNFRRSGGTGSSQAFSTIKLRQPQVTSFAAGGSSGDDIPVESISLSAPRIEYMYRKQLPSGQLTTPVYVCWSIAGNTVTNAQCP